MESTSQAATKRLAVSPDLAERIFETAINLSDRLIFGPAISAVRGLKRRRGDLAAEEQQLIDKRGQRQGLRRWLRAYEKLLISLSERREWLLVTDWQRRLGLDLDDGG